MALFTFPGCTAKSHLLLFFSAGKVRSGGITEPEPKSGLLVAGLGHWSPGLAAPQIGFDRLVFPSVLLTSGRPTCSPVHPSTDTASPVDSETATFTATSSSIFSLSEDICFEFVTTAFDSISFVTLDMPPCLNAQLLL